MKIAPSGGDGMPPSPERAKVVDLLLQKILIVVFPRKIC
jgi:hypothetical protein